MTENIKFSILMPTYNDEKTILEAFNSISAQTYQNYELIVVNDGSTDESEKVIKNYINEHKLNNKFKYVYQQNADQLNAIKTALAYATGDYYYILHSDDLFYDNDVLCKLANICENNKHIDAFIPNSIPTISKDGEPREIIKVRKYKENTNYIKALILNGGMNVFLDCALFKKEAFAKNVLYNYLTWNRPFWADIEQNKTLKLYSLDFPTFKYRIFEENYINSELGLVNVYNGIMRTFIDATDNYSYPLFSLQRFVFRISKKLNFPRLMTGFAFKKPMENKYKAIKSILPKQILHYPYYKSVLGFYKNKKIERTITLDNFPEKIYVGSDMRLFNKLMIKNELPEFYTNFMKEIESGFSKIIISEENENKLSNLLHFFCIKEKVEISYLKD